MNAALRKTGLATLAFTFSLTLGPRFANAQDASRAQALFEDGRRLMGEGHFSEACPKLAASQKLDPGAGTLMNLATCYEKNGQSASAWATFKEAAAASHATNHLDWEAAARARAGKLEPDLARMSITLSAGARAQGVVVQRDESDVDAAELGSPIPIDAGVHVVRARAAGKKTWMTQVTIPGPGARHTLEIPRLDDEPAAAAPSAASPPATTSPAHPPADAPSDGSAQRLLGVAVAGAGVIGVAVGVFFALKASSTQDEALTHCNADNQCNADGIALGKDADSQAAASTVSFIIGGLLVAGGAALYFTAPRAPAHADRDAPRSKDAARHATGLRVGLGGPASVLGLNFGGAF